MSPLDHTCLCVFTRWHEHSLLTCTFVHQSVVNLTGSVRTTFLHKLEKNHGVNKTNAHLTVKSNVTMSSRWSHCKRVIFKGRIFRSQPVCPTWCFAAWRKRLPKHVGGWGTLHGSYCRYGRGRQSASCLEENQKSHLQVWEGYNVPFLC